MLHGNIVVTEKARMPGHPAADPDFAADMQSVAQSQDRDAFARLFQHFAPRIKAFLLKQGASLAQAEELMQETMVTIWQKAHQFDPAKARASTWIFTIARNRRIDRLRKQARADVDLTDPALVPDPLEDGEAVVARSEDRERISAAMRDLSHEQLQVIKLCYYSDMSHSEIANQLDIPIGTVKSRIRLAIARIKAALEDA
ncbi:RNA polymerase sigma-70 factor (ECF subfamily) [Aestuariispira insulae]|uniref:RNA polymerase sigma-70 factor (ECF subfamily) n=2 Tax=Aestuariispira insulae TaxID=1461337 RepID=A0A3D9H8H6_9PROT|nr:RNA polymerase sigma-70 factor (ECF subfamily) [Aestuariispira insulae]